MQEILMFMQQHGALSAALVTILVLLCVIELIKQKQGALRLTPTKVTHLINRENAVIIDVRTTEAFTKGHIVDAVSIPLSELNNKPKKLDKFKSQPIVIVCATGIESNRIAAKLKKQGLNVSVLAGGMRSWQEAGMPLVKA